MGAHAGQYDQMIEYQKTNDHGNADALSWLQQGEDADFDTEEDGDDVDKSCTIHSINTLVCATEPGILKEEIMKDAALLVVVKFPKEGWPGQTGGDNAEWETFQNIATSLTETDDCHGARVVIPKMLQLQALELLRFGNFGFQCMKQLACSVIYWRTMKADISTICWQCTACAEQQRIPNKLPILGFHRRNLGANSTWTMLSTSVDLIGWYLWIGAAHTPVSSRYLHSQRKQPFECWRKTSLILDTQTLWSRSKQNVYRQRSSSWCRRREITQPMGASYHSSTNGLVEQIVKAFKQSIQKWLIPPKEALQQFLMLYRLAPWSTDLAPCEVLYSASSKFLSIPYYLQHPRNHQTQQRTTLEPQWPTTRNWLTVGTRS